MTRIGVGVVWLLAGLFVCLDFGLQARDGIGLEDEGYLWYGAWRVGQGEVPRLDFRGYDAPRNYWLAFWAIPFGDGPVGMRAGAAIFQWLGMGLGLLVVRRLSSRALVLIPAALLLVLWMYPRHKVFEHAIALAAVWVATVFLEKPSGRAAFLSGFFVGLAGSFRRNHALYAFVTFSALLLYSFRNETRPRERWRQGALFLLGVLVGFFPVWVLAALYPGYLSAYWEQITVIIDRGQTNQPLPIPWPWRAQLGAHVPFAQAVHLLGLGLAFLLYYATFAAAAIELLRHRHPTAARTVLLAAFFVGVPYAHHSLVRSDISHLCQAVPPMLLATLALVALARDRGHRLVALATAATLALVTLVVPAYVQPRIARARLADHFVPTDVLGDSLWIWRDQAQLIEAARGLLEESESVDEARIFFAPMLPGLYRILELPVPGWDPYPIWPPSPERESEMVSSLADTRVRWAVIGSESVGGLHFWDSHPQAWAFLESAFEPVAPGPLGFPVGYRVLRRSDPSALRVEEP